jgi:DNA-binding transcriptional LysR family regulator
MMNKPNFRTLDLNLLRVFDEVMAERNLTRAAQNLAMTQPAVSNALRRLRETLGDDLVRRAGYGVEPTPVGLALWPTVRDALAQLRQSLAPGRFEPAQADECLRVVHGRRHGGQDRTGADGHPGTRGARRDPAHPAAHHPRSARPA